MLRVRLLVFLAAAAAAAAEADDQLRFGASTLGVARAVTVHLPAQYADTSQRFPVLYVLDADVHLSHAISSAEFLARAGRIPPLIVAGVTSGENRVRDFTPTLGSLVGAGGRVRFSDSGGARAFLSALVRELVPQIDANYRTRPFRILAGHSLGGLFAIYTITASDSPFNAVIAASPTLTWDDDYVERTLATFFGSSDPPRRDLFVVMGAEEAPNVAAFHRLRGLLTASVRPRVSWATELAEAEDHNSTPLIAFYNGWRFAFGGWRAPLDQLRDLADIERHYRQLSERLHYEVRPPEQTLNTFGYRQLSSGNLAEAIRVFRRNTELYPQSANVYDSLGDALERNKDYAAARRAYAKAVEIAKQNNDTNLPGFLNNLKRLEALLTPVK